jgi:3-dehydroquinate synthase
LTALRPASTLTVDRGETDVPTSSPARAAAAGGPGVPRSDVYVQRFSLPFEYPVYFTRDALDPMNRALREALTRLERGRRHRVFPIVDRGLWSECPGLGARLEDYASHHRDAIELVAPPELVSGGERVKNNPDLVGALQRRFYETGIDRQSFVLILGGGAIQDMAGFAAATTHRGLRVIRMPSTVASQNDSGVGVKNGINAFDVKNFVGAFAPPFAVINDLAFIDTLSDRDRRAGISEAVKVALLRDSGFFSWLVASSADLAGFDPEAMALMIRRSAELHLEHIGGGGDPFEFGSAKPLDFGHWAAHKLESLTGYRLRHGEAVAIGIALDCRYAVEKGLLGAHVLDQVCELLEDLGLELWHDVLGERDATGRLWILDGLAEFREHLGGELTVTMITDPGRPLDVHEIDEASMEKALDWLHRRHASIRAR